MVSKKNSSNNLPQKDYQELYKKELDDHLKTKIKLNARELELHLITESNSYKVAKKLALVKHASKVASNHLKRMTPSQYKLYRDNEKYIKRIYTSRGFNDAFIDPVKNETAVVLHLYYPELMAYFKMRLDILGNASIQFDLYITLPDDKISYIDQITDTFPGCKIAIVPNCGRDVLPFLEVVRKLDALGYEKVLKIHTKKSPHRSDGDSWRDAIISQLIPKNKTVIKEITSKLDDKKTAIIGPSDEYVSFLVNYPATSHHTKKILTKSHSEKFARELQSKADEYGFFAGTMFWARIDALVPLAELIHMTDFEPEQGQEDSTMAHALERLFCVLPELNGRNVYGSSDERLARLEYHTSNIPEWSDFAVKL